MARSKETASAEQVAERLHAVRRELDEMAEHVDRLAREMQLRPAEPELVGMSEIAEMLGVTVQAVADRSKRGTLPAPMAVLKCGKVWRLSEIRAWIRKKETAAA